MPSRPPIHDDTTATPQPTNRPRPPAPTAPPDDDTTTTPPHQPPRPEPRPTPTTPPSDDTPDQPRLPAGRRTPTTPPSDDTTTTSDQPACPLCGTRFTRVRRQRFCSDNCRKAAWGRAHAAPRPEPVPVPPRGQRLAATIYACGDCGTRYHGLQWCPDCNTPCTRVGPGGPCPHCDEPVTIADLLPPARRDQPR